MGKKIFMLERPEAIRAQLGADLQTLGSRTKLPPLLILPSTRQSEYLVIDTRLSSLPPPPKYVQRKKLIWVEDSGARRMGLPRATYLIRKVWSNVGMRMLAKGPARWPWMEADRAGFSLYGRDDGLPLERVLGLMSYARGHRSVLVLPEEFRVCGDVTGTYDSHKSWRDGAEVLQYLQAADTAVTKFVVEADSFADLREKVAAAARVYSSIDDPAELMDRSFPKRLGRPERREYRDAVRFARSRGLTPRELAAVGGDR